MAFTGTYSAASHSTPMTTTIDSQTYYGQGPGGVMAQLLGDQHSAPTGVWMANSYLIQGGDVQAQNMVYVTVANVSKVS